MAANEKEIALAVKMMDTFCSMLEEDEVGYKRNDEKFLVSLTFSGNDFPLDIVFRVIPERQLIIIYSPLTFTIPPEGRGDVAIAMTELNNRLFDGVWTMDIATGEVEYRITNSYYDSILGKACLKDLMNTALRVNNGTADKLFMLGKGNMTLDQFCESVFGK